MFLKPTNSNTENGIKKNLKCHLEKNYAQRKLENWKSEMNKTVKTSRFLFFFFKLPFLAAGGQPPPPIGGMSS